MARVTVRHLAVAPTVGVYADSSVAITPSFSNGQTAAAVVPPSSYDVTVTAAERTGYRPLRRRQRVVGGRHQHARLRERRLPVDLHRGGTGDPHHLSDRRGVTPTAPGPSWLGAVA